jgi:glutaredoxin-dependent peroxiredoxin
MFTLYLRGARGSLSVILIAGLCLGAAGWPRKFRTTDPILTTMALSKDSKAPDFVLKHKSDTGLVDVRLSDNFGQKKTVLLFFPLAFTSVCTSELCSVRDSLNQYASLNASVYGISVDSPFSLHAFAQAQNINFPLLSDFNREVSKAYDVLAAELAGLKGVAKRSAFVISEDGTILFASSSDDPKVLPDFDAIKKVLQN